MKRRKEKQKRKTEKKKIKKTGERNPLVPAAEHQPLN